LALVLVVLLQKRLTVKIRHFCTNN
jgi:hypothetical protein